MKPSLDDLIEQALKLPPGPKSWAIIFEHYPELILTPEALAQKFRESAARVRCGAPAGRNRSTSLERPESALCSRWLTTRRMGEDVESPGGLSPPGAPRSVREPLDSYGSRCSRTRRSPGCGARHIVRYVFRKGSQLISCPLLPRQQKLTR